MISQKIVSSVLHACFLLLVGFLTWSFTSPDTIEVPATYSRWLIWFRENWSIVALLLSEIAALLPGKPKGVIQWFLLLGSKMCSLKRQERKNYLL
jgi:hypothetical protein